VVYNFFMVMSMTGYGLSKNDLFQVEMRSHNHRFCEILLRLPPQLIPLEHKIREHIKNRIARGRIQVVVECEPEEHGTLTIDQETARRFITVLRDAGNSLNLQDDLSLSHLVPVVRGLTTSPKEERYTPEEFWEPFKEALDKAIDNLLVMRAEEGQELYKEILKRLRNIRQLLEEVKERIDEVVAEYKKKLSKRISELLANEKIEGDRLNMEVAIFAEKSDITEEVVRLTSHLEQAEQTLNTEGSIGKRLDFLSQELNRELNTIASKTTSIKIIQNVIAMKDELEKIREQVQNVE